MLTCRSKHTEYCIQFDGFVFQLRQNQDITEFRYAALGLHSQRHIAVMDQNNRSIRSGVNLGLLSGNLAQMLGSSSSFSVLTDILIGYMVPELQIKKSPSSLISGMSVKVQ